MNKTITFFQGNVGIGTFNPQSALAINGQITARGSVQVTVKGLSNDVFDTGYELMPIQTLSAYFSEYKHLSRVASERQVLKQDKRESIGECPASESRKTEYLYYRAPLITRKGKFILSIT